MKQEFFLIHPNPDHSANSFQKFMKTESGSVNLHFPGFDFGQVQYLIDQTQQVISAPFNHIKPFPLEFCGVFVSSENLGIT